VEEARGLQRLIQGKGWTQAAAAAALGKSKAEVSALLRILTLPEEVQEAVLTSELDIPKHALIELARVEPAARDRLIELARAGALTIKAIRAAAEKDRARDGPPPRRAGAPRLGAKAIERVTDGLRAARAAGRPLDEAGRERLVRLKQEIEAYLARD
jgi:ParB family chromosome partitioning protein